MQHCLSPLHTLHAWQTLLGRSCPKRMVDTTDFGPATIADHTDVGKSALATCKCLALASCAG
eukprot:7102667-Alexandrium_andersonii.AAC.1